MENSSTIKKLGVLGLTAVVVSSMVGSGVYSLPQNMAAAAGVDAMIIAWIITGLGMFFIADTFRLLSSLKPNARAGFFSYAREGFGKRIGFGVFWGYWLCQVFANIGFSVIIMETLNYFFPHYFEGGNNLHAFILSSMLIWFFTALVWRGIQTAALVNLIGTIVKIIPVFIFLAIALFVFHWHKFDLRIFGKIPIGQWNWGDMLSQVKNTMLVTLWSFIGIETAVAITHRAKSHKDIARATLFSFVLCLVIYSMISLLPFGILPREEIVTFPNPSTAGILAAIIGRPGAWLMNIGLIISTLFAFLSWTIICVEIPFIAAREGSFPAQFAAENKHGAPKVSIITTGVVMQAALLLAFFSAHAWNTMISITGVMLLPVYFITALYMFKIRNQKQELVSKTRLTITAVLALVYSVWLIYAANITYLLMASFFFALGIPVFLWARRQKKIQNV
ncbi:MAG: basic amino acid/polyamine antiporter [Elusimicrobia bacterium]|nr:basic amino acid/polyamine antiporter [Elusimicrobiota bacterium]